MLFSRCKTPYIYNTQDIHTTLKITPTVIDFQVCCLQNKKGTHNEDGVLGKISSRAFQNRRIARSFPPPRPLCRETQLGKVEIRLRVCYLACYRIKTPHAIAARKCTYKPCRYLYPQGLLLIGCCGSPILMYVVENSSPFPHRVRGGFKQDTN